MSTHTRFIAKLEKILNLLKNSKLEYLKASEAANLTDDKRFFNQQSTLRNRFFQDITSLLRRRNVEVENLQIHRLNFERMATSTLIKNNISHIQRAMDCDGKLLELYDEAMVLAPDVENLKFHQETIAAALAVSAHSLEKSSFVLES